MQKLLHTETFTHRRFYTDAFTHRCFYPHTLLHTDALRTEPFTHRPFDRTNQIRKKLSVCHPWTSRRAKQLLLDQPKSQFYCSFCRSALMMCERAAAEDVKSQFYISFCRLPLISCERVTPEVQKSQFKLTFSRSGLIFCERNVTKTSWGAGYLFFANEVRIRGLGRGRCLNGSKIVTQVVIWAGRRMPFEGHVPCGKTVTVAIDSPQVRFSWGSQVGR